MAKKSSNSKLLVTGLYEYAFIPVPQRLRKSNMDLFFVLAGFTSALSCLVLGAKIGASMPFWQAIGACFFGDALLIIIGTGMGMLSASSGWSTAFLAQRILGKSASVVFTLLLLLCTVIWVGVNGNLFATMIISVFQNWSIPLAVTTLVVIILWGQSAAYGWKGLNLASKIVVPCTLGLLAFSMFNLFTKMEGIGFLFALPTSVPMPFAVASSAVVGNFIFGCISTPDTCRFAKSPKAAAIICPSAYASGMFLFHVCGVIIAKAGGSSDFNRSASVLGILIPLLICAIFCLATTQNMNIYISSLALQNILQGTRLEGNVSHKTAVYLMAGTAAALSVSGLGNYLVPMVSYFSILMVPLPGMLFAEALFFGKMSKKNTHPWYTIAIWIASSIAGSIFIYFDLPIATFLGMLFAFICYFFANKWRKNS